MGIIKVDVDDSDSLAEMAKKGKVIVNCVGPYRYKAINQRFLVLYLKLEARRFYGEPVVKACVENGASHIDISGEIQVSNQS